MALCSCAATVGLEHYPQRVIDRPYVLPENVQSWDLYAGVSREGFRGAPMETDYSLRPQLLQERGTDAGRGILRTVLIPVPIGMRHTLLHRQTDVVGCLVLLGGGYDKDAGWLLEPTAEIYGRHKISRDLAWEGWPWR